MKSNQQFILFTSLLVFILFPACEEKREALGADNEIRIICSELDKEVLGEALAIIFSDIIYTPQPEPYYYFKFSDPEHYDNLKEQAYVVIGAVNRDPGNPGLQLVKKLLPEDQFTSSSLDDPILFTRDVYAYKQLFMIMNSRSADQLIAAAKEKKHWIQKQFHNQFIHRQEQFLFGDDRNIDLEKAIKEEYGWNIKIPWGWEMIRSIPDSNFVWIGREMPFQWISIHWERGIYVDDELTAGEYLWGWPEKHYGSVKFNDYHFQLKNTKFKGYNAWRGDGVWETINEMEAKGGPFRSYLFYDQNNHRTYHINMLIYNPGNDKSLYMRQLDLIAKTFKTG